MVIDTVNGFLEIFIFLRFDLLREKSTQIKASFKEKCVKNGKKLREIFLQDLV